MLSIRKICKRHPCPNDLRELAVLLLALHLAPAQTPGVPQVLEFEVASVRPAIPDDDHSIDSDGGRFFAHNLTLKRLVALGWDVDESLVRGGPNWISSDVYDINAKIPTDTARVKIPEMIQSLLAKRFHLITHREPSTISGYALGVAKNGPKLQISKLAENGAETSAASGHIAAKNITMERFAIRLSRVQDIDRVVVDQTGLTGRFDFELAWTPDASAGDNEPIRDRTSIFTALQEQLGLKLAPGKVPVLTVIVDRAQKPDAN